MSKHTPLPWVAMPHKNDSRRFQVRGPNESGPTGYSVSSDSTEANAKLIAAAPAMLAALNDARESLLRLPDVDGAYRVTCIWQIDKAIKAATE